jgi:exodeoxyribonuclease VII large subunit
VTGLATVGGVEAIVVSRGGGSLTDLWAFCDESLCRTVAMLAVPVYSAVGHERDVTLLDDVAAVRCSTPTHAAEEVVRFDLVRARADLIQRAGRAARFPVAAIRARALPLSARAAAPARAVRAQRAVLDQKAREVRASSERGLSVRSDRLRSQAIRGLVPGAARAARSAATGFERAGRAAADLEAAARALIASGRSTGRAWELTLRAHDPQRTLERGYARVEDEVGEAIVKTSQARVARRLSVIFADGRVEAEVAAARRRRRRTRPKDPAEFGQTRLEGIDPDE